MKDLQEIPFIQENKAWYFFSVYYVRENWLELIVQINQFYQDRRDKFCACLISFSDNKGEQVEICLATSILQENMKNEIEQFFLPFVNDFPSVRKAIFPYGKVVWSDYPNNSLLWYRFRKMDLQDSYIYFHQSSFHFALSLIENDTSHDTLFSLCLYLIAKGLNCIETKNQKSLLSDALYDTSIDFKNYGHINSVKILIDKHIDSHEIYSILDSYWAEKESDFSPELKIWLTNTKEFIVNYSYTNFCSFICTMFGLKGLHQLMILELINTWFNNRQDEE